MACSPSPLDSWAYYSCHSTVITVGIVAVVSLMTTSVEGRIVGTSNLSVYRLTVLFLFYVYISCNEALVLPV